MVDTYNRLLGARAALADKKPCRGASTGGTLTLSGYQTVDGVTFQAADETAGRSMRILVKDQTDQTQNGIYLVNSGVWTREKDFDGNTDFVQGTLVYVTGGSVNGGYFFVVSSADPQGVGTSAITFSAFTVGDIDTLTVHGADIASSATVDLDAATGNLIDITGTVTVTAVSLADGRERTVRFTGALTLTNGASLVLPGGQNIVTTSGDYAIFRGYAAGIVRCVAYQRFNGQPLQVGAATIASDTTVDLGSVREQCISITGTNTITSFGSSAPAGVVKLVTFTGILTLTHNGTSLILPAAGNIVTAAGNTCIAESLGGGNWRVPYFPGAGSASTNPTVQEFTTGTGTVTPSANVKYWRVRMVGGGGGGAGGAAGAVNGTAGANTSFGTWTAVGGGGGGAAGGAGGTGGATGTGTQICRFAGQDGGSGMNSVASRGGAGGSSVFGGGGPGGSNSSAIGHAAKANTGSGGGSGCDTGSSYGGGGAGAAGEYLEFFVTGPNATSYAVGAAGAGGVGGNNGGNGAAGCIIVEEFYS